MAFSSYDPSPEPSSFPNVHFDPPAVVGVAALLLGLMVFSGCKSMMENISMPGGSQDCIAIDASEVRVERDGGAYVVTDGQSRMLQAASERDARDMAALARQHESHCFIGRDNTRADRDTYVFEYWKGQSSVDGDAPPESDCISYDPTDLRIVDEGSDGYVLTDGRSRMAMLDNEIDAEKALDWARGHTRHCFIGRDNNRRNRADYITSFWAGTGMSTYERRAAREADDEREATTAETRERTATGSATNAPPAQIQLRFDETTIVYEPGWDGPQVAADNHVLSYGDDWDVREVKPFLYHVRYTYWDDFYWKVNTSRQTVYRVENGTFGRLGGESDAVSFDLSVRGSGDNPSRFTVTIPNARWLYDPATGSRGAAGPQMLVDDDVLSYRQGWEVEKLKPFLYHARRSSWDGFYWKINTSREQVYVVKGGTFGQYGGTDDPMPADVTIRQ
ncbi:hypothetical protein CRI94_13395 [Longibacter salinarum]|uniref:Uncharacterized protein n=1 Tax=Longibacter salinarum TaxID=1850348 RepID=A0A2A8CV41_9BACT|nr:hypothetical protein [Longibacter salinarum]PEN12516.1 hypothetical protein CRI94_13395 [Longibacter salinarum]